MGTPEFAVASLEELHTGGFHIAAVVTSPDKPAGRGRKIRTSAVKDYAIRHKIRVLQPEKLKDPQFLGELDQIQPDLIIVVAFRMLPQQVWDYPPLGTINLHASLLPQYRGAAPINRAIMNGEKETGVTTFFIEKEIDTGKIILQQSTPIRENDDAGLLHKRLKKMGAELLVKTVRLVLQGNPPMLDQSELIRNAGVLKTAPRIYPEDCRIDWNRPVSEVYNHIRGLSPHPTAWTHLKSGDHPKVMKVFAADKEEVAVNDPPGSVVVEDGRRLLIACPDGYIHIRSLQIEGKKRIYTEDFLRGIKDLSGLSID
jgi:methionyl-tRNA formyltransferase